MYQTFQGNTIHNSGLRYCTVSCQRMKFRLTDKQYCLPRLPKMFGKWKQFWVTMEFAVKRSSNKRGNSKAQGGNRTFYIDSTSGLWNLVSLKNNSSKLVCSEVRTPLSRKQNFLVLVLFSKIYSSAILNNAIPIIEWCLKLSLRVSH